MANGDKDDTVDNKVDLHLTHVRDVPTVDQIAALTERITGRPPTPAEREEMDRIRREILAKK